MEITISRATPADLPRLAELNRLAYMYDAAVMVAFTHWPAEKEMHRFFLNSLRNIMQSPNNHFFKATSAASGEIVGFASLMLVEGAAERVEPAPAVSLPGGIKTAKEIEFKALGLDVEFMSEANGEILRLKRYMKGRKHYCM